MSEIDPGVSRGPNIKKLWGMLYEGLEEWAEVIRPSLEERISAVEGAEYLGCNVRDDGIWVAVRYKYSSEKEDELMLVLDDVSEEYKLSDAGVILYLESDHIL